MTQLIHGGRSGSSRGSLFALGLSAATLSSAPIPITERPQLLLDDFIVHRTEAVERMIHQPRDIAANPVMAPEHPWEHRRIPFGSVLWFPEEKKFRCWYLTLNIYDSRPGFRGYRKEHHVPVNEAAFICYAESRDGVHWTRPGLGLHEFRGSKENNIVLVSPGTHFDSLSVMRLPHDREWPFRMMVFIGRWPYKDDPVRKKWGDPPPFGIQRHGHFAFGSKDGIHWKELNGNEPVLRVSDRSMFWWNPDKRIFVGAAKRSRDGKRAQAYAWSRDMIHWTITPDWIHHADERDHPGDEGEAAYGFPYGDQWVGFAEMRRVRRNQDTRINWELLGSRDGRHWSRPVRGLFFADAGRETWRHKVFKVFANPPIERDGRLLIYYGGKTGRVPLETGYEPFQALCLATLRKDGFASLRAGDRTGELITKPLLMKGARLSVNLATRENGDLRVEAQDVAGAPIKGFALSDSDPVVGDHLDHRVTWNGDGDVASLSSRVVRLRFVMRDVDLYSFKMIAQ
jgi:hypothetical protein